MDEQRPKTARPRTESRKKNNRVILATVLLACALAVVILHMAATDGWGLWHADSYGLPDSYDGYRGGVLILTDPGISSANYALVRKVLFEAGYTSWLWSGSKVEKKDITALSQLLEERIESYLAEEKSVWIMGSVASAEAVPEWLDPSSVSGFIWVGHPDDWDEWDRFQAAAPQQAMIVLGPDRDQDRSRAWFEHLTGEDATIFSGFQTSGVLQETVWQSTDGRTILALYPVFKSEFAWVSFRILPDLAGFLSTGDSHVDAVDRVGPTASRTLWWLYQLICAIVWLSAVPIIINGLMRRPDLDPIIDLQPVRIPRELFFWSVSLIVAFPLSWLLQKGTAGQIDWLSGTVLLTPACHGWLHVSWRMVNGADRPLCAHNVRSCDLWCWINRAGFILFLIVMIHILMLIPGFGVNDWRAWLLPVLAVFMIGMGPVGASADRFSQNKNQIVSWRHIPYILLVLILLGFRGYESAIMAIVFLIVILWAESLGTAIMRMTRSWVWGSIIQAVILAWILLPLAQML